MAHVNNVSVDNHVFLEPSSSHSNHTALSRRSDNYRRNYRACELCRRKKVRCDLGDLSNPQPPCAKCKREKKDCMFAPGLSNRAGRARERKSAYALHSNICLIESVDVRRLDRLSTPLPSTPEERGGSVTSQRQEQHEFGDTWVDASALETASNISRQATVNQSAGNASEHQSDLLSSGSGLTTTNAPISQSLVETVVRDDTDALHLLFDVALRRVHQKDQPSAPDVETNPQPNDDYRDQESAGSTALNSASLPQSGAPLSADPSTIADRELYGRLPRLDPEQVALWSHFPPCSQRFLSPAEVVAYLDLSVVTQPKDRRYAD